MNKKMCNDSFRRLREEGSAIKWINSIWLVLHDNASAHQSVLVKYFLIKNK